MGRPADALFSEWAGPQMALFTDQTVKVPKDLGFCFSAFKMHKEGHLLQHLVVVFIKVMCMGIWGLDFGQAWKFELLAGMVLFINKQQMT